MSGAFRQVHGSTAVRADTVAVRAGFACYGEQDDDVQSVLLDDVVLRRIDPGSGARLAATAAAAPRGLAHQPGPR